MHENSFIKQYKKYKEDLKITSVEPASYYDDENHIYILDNNHKKMIIEADFNHPYDTFKYYFLQSNPTLEADNEVMTGCFDDRWELGINGKLDIKCDDITYSNLIVDTDLIDKIIKSINNLEEDIDFHLADEKGYWWDNKSKILSYAMGIEERKAFIELLNKHPEILQSNLFRFTSVEDFKNHLYAKWTVVDGSIMCAPDGYVSVIIADINDQENDYFNASFEVPLDYLKEFIFDTDVEDAIDKFKKVKQDIKEDIELSSDIPYENVLAEAIADRIGDCKVDGNVIYYLVEDFEMYGEEDEYGNEEYREIPYGIFSIYKVFPNGGVAAYNAKIDVCEDVDNIGIKDPSYYIGYCIGFFNNLSEFIEHLNSYFGRGWFGTNKETAEFLNDYDPNRG